MGPQYQLFVFLGRLTHQKGGDLIVIAAKAILAASNIVQACPLILHNSLLYWWCQSLVGYRKRTWKLEH